MQGHAALLAMTAGRPVLLTLTRRESLRYHSKRHPMWLTYTLGCDVDGRLVALRARIVGDTGAYASVGDKVLERAAGHACSAYAVPNVDVDAKAVYTNNPPCGAMRGFGVNQSNFAVEGVLDALAERVGIDGWEIRWRNALDAGETFGTGQVLGPGVGLKKTLLAVRDAYRGARFAGIACGVKNTGIGNGVPEFGHAILRPESDGSITLYHSWTEMGQGVHTVLRQIACEELDLPPERIRVLVSTERELDTGQTTASRSTVLGGNAVLDAARKLKAALDGRPLETLAGQEFRGEFMVDWTTANDAEAPVTHLAYAWATQVVTLDDEGRLAKVVAAHDVGRAINPTLVEGQIEGAVHMGLGQALSEEFVVEGGVPLTETLKSLHIIPPTGNARSRVRPRRGAAARRPVRRQGRRRSSARAHCCRSRGRVARVRRHPQDAAAHEGLAGGARRGSASHAGTEDGHGMILTGATVVSSLDPLRIVWEDVHVAGGRIAANGGAETRDCSGCLIVPGNVCAHTHLYSALARGMPYTLDPPKDFVQILQRVWWRLDRALDEKAVRASALVGGMEALLSGTTTVVDHHASPNAIDGSLDVIAEALGTLGVRSILCYETSDRDGPERARAGVEENRRFVQSVGQQDPSLTRGMIGAHASFTLSDETLEACVDAARAHGVGIHVHAAEDTADEDDAVTVHGLRVAERLAHAGALDRRTLLAHGVHLDDSEIGLIEAAHARSRTTPAPT